MLREFPKEVRRRAVLARELSLIVELGEQYVLDIQMIQPG